MNIIVKNQIIYYYEGIMRYNEKIYKEDLDYANNPFPYPKENKKYDTENILNKLINIEIILSKQNKFKSYKKNKNCPLCNQKNISTIIYNLANIHWDDGFKHFIAQHYYKPSHDFINFINGLEVKNNEIHHNEEHGHKDNKKILLRMPGIIIKREKKSYINISRNQMLILDALMNDGGYAKKYIDTKQNLRWSEHAGLLDFSNKKLDKIIVSGKTQRTDKDDHEIFLPLNMIEAYDYEYIFHTHPPTPYPGGRIREGIVYEFPSISDIFHFIEHYNNGNVQGSMVIAPEGIYIIKSTLGIDDKIIINDEDKVFEELTLEMLKIQDEAIRKYGKNVTEKIFFEKISQNRKYIKKFNEKLKQYNIKIVYKPREKDKSGKWVINGLSVAVNPIEPIKVNI
jgi:hypothetical protein